jgi:uncharacterized membrane protein
MAAARDQMPRPATVSGNIPAPRPLTPSEFNTALVHLYRGEVSRANTWRSRLDGTTNWAVLTTGATLSFAFSSPGNTHVMILINSLLIAFFLWLEARRYRYYDLWRARIRLMETEFFADLLVPQDVGETEEHWRELLAADLWHPRFTITMWEAMGRRLRRNYIWIFGVLTLSWIIKVGIHPSPTTDFTTVLSRAQIGPVNGWIVILTGVVFNGALFVLGIVTSSRFHQLRIGHEAQSRDEARRRMSAQG